MCRIFIACVTLIITFACTYHDINKQFDCANSDLALVLDSIFLASGCGISDGAIYVTAQGGKEPYAFAINDEPTQDLGSFTGLLSGIYSIKVIDENGCEASFENLSVLAKDFQFLATVVQNTGCLNNNGSITIEVQEGNAPFMYKLGDSQFSDNNVFSSLAPGQYVITVEDATLCTVQLKFTVPRANTNTSWLNEILPIMKTSCAINGCHDGKTRKDFRQYVNVKNDLQQVKTLTKNGSMPFDGTPLLQTQIDLIVCWVDDGGLDN